MAVVSRIAKVRIADTATGLIFREWVATAVTQDTAAGASVDVTITQTTGGATPPGVANTLTLNLYTDAGALIRAFTLTPSSSSQTVSFFFTADGTSGGATRAGTVEIAIRATRTDVGTYDVESDGSPNTPGAGNTSTTDRGWIRGTTTATTTLSNVALGGAKSQPAEYDESIFARTTLGAALYVARALTVAVSGGGLSGATNSTASGNWDVSFANVVDDRFPAAVTVAASSLTVPNATLTGQPATVLTATNDTLDVDPRLTASHHFQVDDATFATSKNDTSKSMLSTQSGFLAARIVTARTAAGVNGLTVTQTLTPVGPGTAVSGSSSTATRDTQAGWTDLLAWTSSKPGGTWNKASDVTAPSDIDPDSYLLAGTDAYTMLAPDPRVSVMVSFGTTTASEDDHLHAGDATSITVTAFSRDTGKRLAPDAGTVMARLTRWNRTASRFEFLAADGSTWTAWTGTTTVADQHALTDAGDTVTFTKNLSSTNWGTTDLVAVQVTLKIGGTPYGFYIGRELTGTYNKHSGVALDPVAFALGGLVSFR